MKGWPHHLLSKSISSNVMLIKTDQRVQQREWDERQVSHFLTIFSLRTEPPPSQLTVTRKTSHQAVAAARALWRRTAAWRRTDARVVTVSAPPNPGSGSTAPHWCSSLTTRTPTQWVITPFLLISVRLCRLTLIVRYWMVSSFCSFSLSFLAGR